MQVSIYCVLSARHVSGLHAHLQEQWMLNFFTYTAYGVLGVVGCRSWGVCVLVACCSAYKPETCRADSTQINIQLHQVGKLIHNSNQNARYNYPKSLIKILILSPNRMRLPSLGLLANILYTFLIFKLSFPSPNPIIIRPTTLNV